MSRRSGPFRIITVCTGNIARSPAAERLLRVGLGGPVVVESAGTGAVVGAPIEPAMAALLARDGVDVENFQARAVTESMIRDADLVLPLTRSHRSIVVDMVPAAVRRTFTLREYAAIVRMIGPAMEMRSGAVEALTDLTMRATLARTELSLAPEDRDVPDPYGRADLDYRLAFDLIRESTAEIISLARRIARA
ncbi:MAG TPA: hypothetical protein VFC82_07450 [Actinomycetaceae bacterium]|nr:hypothetical protein [Actinomycetaceae bacterium]